MAVAHQPVPAAAAPRRGRRTLLQFTFALSLITFLDRVAISGAAPAIREQLHLGPAQMAWVFSAFTFAYAMFPSVIGIIIDKIGVKKALAAALVIWSVAAAAHGLVGTVLGFVIVQVLLLLLALVPAGWLARQRA